MASIGWRCAPCEVDGSNSNWTIGSGRRSLRSWQRSGAQVGDQWHSIDSTMLRWSRSGVRCLGCGSDLADSVAEPRAVR